METISTAQPQGNPDTTQQDDSEAVKNDQMPMQTPGRVEKRKRRSIRPIPPAQEEVIDATQDKADHKRMASMNTNDEIIRKFNLKQGQHLLISCGARTALPSAI
jgi:hypothetical protein